MIQQPSNVLQHYLTSINDETAPKAKQTRKKRSKQQGEQNAADQENRVSIDITTSFLFASTLQMSIKREYESLTDVQHAIVSECIRYSLGQPVPYNAVANELSSNLSICVFEVKQELARLLDKQVVLAYTHAWRGKLIRVAPLWRQYFLSDKQQEAEQPHLAACQLISDSVTRPFEKQLIFMMQQLKNTSLLLNQKKELNKSAMTELRGKILTINPLLRILDEPTFHIQQEAHFLQGNHFVYECEDAVVRFVLEIACILHFVEKQEHEFKWLEHNWLRWLDIEEHSKHLILKLIAIELLSQKTIASDSYLFMNLLATPEHWIKLKNSRHKNNSTHKNASNIIELAFAFGWIEAVYEKKTCYIKRSSQIVTNSSPQLHSNFQVLCFPDCSSRSVWDLLHIAKLEQNQQLLIFQLDAKSIQQAYSYGYSVAKIAAILKLDDYPQWLPQWERLYQLAEKLCNNTNHDHILINEKKCSASQLKQIELGAGCWCSPDLIYTIGHLVHPEPNFIAHELQDTQIMLKSYPDQWFTKLRAYHASTLKEIVEVAQHYGLELEVKFGTMSYRGIPFLSCEQNNDMTITINHSHNMQALAERKRLNIEQLSKNVVRLIREY